MQKEEGQIIDAPFTQPISTEKGNIIKDDDEDSSQWSLASLQELKALNLRDLGDDEQPHEYQQKTKPALQVKFPDKPTILVNAPLHQVGKVIYVVGELIIVESLSGAFVVDLDNWLCDEQRNLIGFVIDVIGKIENPYYALRPQIIGDVNSYLGRTIFYMEGSSKILRDEDIKSMKSKSALDLEEGIEDCSDDQNERVQRDFSDDKNDRVHDRRQSPPSRRPHKIRQNQGREDHRDRTRDNRFNRNNSRPRNQQNQKYLQSMYSMHFNQMMRFYNPNGQQNNNTNPIPGQMQMQNPFLSMPNQLQNHQNIAQFGSGNQPNQIFGQGQMFNNQQAGIFGNPQPNQQNNPFGTPNQSQNSSIFGTAQQPNQSNQFQNRNQFGGRQQ